MSLPRLAVVSEPVSADALARELEAAMRFEGEGCGAVCTFAGIVRATHQDRRVRHLEYEAFAPLALKAFARIQEEIAAEWPATTVAIHHRVGRLAIGDVSVAIAAASAHRARAFQACRYAIERIKQVVPIWKHEYFEDGDVWVEGAAADIEDEAARRQARERACA
jgi:molybdopterin synthase catalytic subunit